MSTTRRDCLAAMAAAGFRLPIDLDAAPASSDLEAAAVTRHDRAVEQMLKLQITDPSHPHCGIYPDAYGLHNPGTASGLIDIFNTAFHHRLSKFHKNPLMIERLKLAAGYLKKAQTADGNINLLITNFNSPPDTAFVILGVARAASIARKHGSPQVVAELEPFLRRAAHALTVGGVHTPNHRWVVCSALALIQELYPDDRHIRRIDQWLAEGIDIDEDGQYDERSTLSYSPIIDTALVTLAAKLNRAGLLDPVRKNLDCALWLMHADGELVSEISHRQDRDTRGNIGVYWFPMHYLAVLDSNPVYAWVARKHAAERASLSLLMEYPELLKPLPEGASPAENYEKVFRSLEIVRIRRGLTSATILLRGDSRFFQLRHGDAVLHAVRFASAFFGKGQFKPQTWAKAGNSYVLRQALDGPYFQPFDPPQRVKAGEWNETRPGRARSQVSLLEQKATITEIDHGFRVRVQAVGTADVPVAVEVGVRGAEGLQMDGLLPAPDGTDSFLLASGSAMIRAGGHKISFGPGKRAHAYTQVRGAEPKLPGGSVYVTGFTPFDHTLEFECSP